MTVARETFAAHLPADAVFSILTERIKVLSIFGVVHVPGEPKLTAPLSKQ